MKNTMFAVMAAGLVSLGCGQAMAEGQVSSDALAQMGLPGLKVMSDAQGEEIRGKGAFAFGISYAGVHGAGSVNVSGYKGKHFAAQKNGSYASKKVVIKKYGHSTRPNGNNWSNNRRPMPPRYKPSSGFKYSHKVSAGGFAIAGGF